MNSVAEALNTLISAVNVAHNKGGIYSLEESHYIYLAISYFNTLQNQAPANAAGPVTSGMNATGPVTTGANPAEPVISDYSDFEE